MRSVAAAGGEETRSRLRRSILILCDGRVDKLLSNRQAPIERLILIRIREAIVG